MDFDTFGEDASENSDDSLNAEETFFYIQAEKVEQNKDAETSNKVEEELEEFMRHFRISSEKNIDEIFHKAKVHRHDLNKRLLLEQKYFKEDHNNSLSELEYSFGRCDESKRNLIYKQLKEEKIEFEERKRKESLEETNKIIIKGKRDFLSQQQLILDELKPSLVETSTDYVICQELECPVCLTEMLPPVRIWQCSAGHAICQTCKRNPNIHKKCPTCRQALIGRATALEKMAASLFRKSTGKEVDEVEEDNDGNEEDDEQPDEEESEETTATDVLHMLYLPMRHHARGFRSPVENLEDEITRLINNISFIQSSRNSGLL